MNERIRELVKQAGGHFSTHNLMSDPVQHRESIELWDKNIEKFAKLIVLECAKFLDGNSGYNCCNNEWHPDLEDLLKHFGIEE